MSNAIKKGKAVYTGNRRLIIIKTGNDHKAFWRMMKTILPGDVTCINKHFYWRNLTSDKNLIADSFNKFFRSSVTRLLEPVWSYSCASGVSPS